MPIRKSLARVALSGLWYKLTDAQAQAALDPILELIKHQTGSSGSTGQMLGEALQALAVKLTDAQAQAALDPIVAVIKQTAANPYVVSPLAQALQALAGKLTDAQVPGLLPPVRGFLANAKGDKAAEAWASVIAELVGHEPNDALLSVIVDVLKYPTAAGKPTDALMAALQKHFPNVPELKGGLDAAVPWLEKQVGAEVVERVPVRPN